MIVLLKIGRKKSYITVVQCALLRLLRYQLIQSYDSLCLSITLLSISCFVYMPCYEPTHKSYQPPTNSNQLHHVKGPWVMKKCWNIRKRTWGTYLLPNTLYPMQYALVDCIGLIIWQLPSVCLSVCHVSIRCCCLYVLNRINIQFMPWVRL